jgi:hypothetical protein
LREKKEVRSRLFLDNDFSVGRQNQEAFSNSLANFWLIPLFWMMAGPPPT